MNNLYDTIINCLVYFYIFKTNLKIFSVKNSQNNLEVYNL